MIDVRVLRAAGLTDAQIVAVLEAVAPLIAEVEQSRERQAVTREQNRKRKQNQRARHGDSHGDSHGDIKKLNGINGDVTRDSVTQKRKGSVPPKEKILPSTDSYRNLFSEAGREFGERVVEILRTIPPQPDDARILHNIVEQTLSEAGIQTSREYRVPLENGNGFIDLVCTSATGDLVGIELDRRLPRAKSLQKLQVLGGYRIAITRSENPPAGFTEIVDQIVSIAPIDTRTEQERQLFERGKQVLGKSAGGMIANLFKAREYNISLTRAVIETASTKQDPREYVAGAIRGGNGNGQALRHNGIHRETLTERCDRLADEARRREFEAGIGRADDAFGGHRGR